jgi:hypothetical protein
LKPSANFDFVNEIIIPFASDRQTGGREPTEAVGAFPALKKGYF